MQNAKDLGTLIRRRRKELGATQKDLALASGTGVRFLVDLEKGKPSCQIGKVLQVLQACGLRLVFEDLETGKRRGASHE